MEKQLLLQIMLSFGLAVILGLLSKLYSKLVAAPQRLRRVLKQQGFEGPPPVFLLGNILEIKNQPIPEPVDGAPASHNCGAALFPTFEGWRRQYGDICMFSLANKPVLLVNKYDVVKEVTTCTSLDFGRPSYQANNMESLLGNGIISANGKSWAYQRKILAPELFIDKVKGMTNLIQQSSSMLVDSWKGLIDAGGGKADIKIAEYLRKFSGDVISRACFGSNYSEGEEFIETLRALQLAIARKGLAGSIPGMRHVPTKNNRREWELQGDVRELILKLVQRKNEQGVEKNMLQMILEGAEQGNLRADEIEKFVIDNCKNIYIAGYETTAIVASWCLMLLASNPEWQHRVREEVIGVCNERLPDSDSTRQMKQLTMVINETLRLYPPLCIVAREALNDLEIANVRIPKGVSIWVMMTSVHTDPDIWGSDSYEFNPERFANGTAGACKLPHLFMPFGVGPRICLGINLAMLELKILLSFILSNFSFTLSSKYVHAPTMNLVVEPRYGVDLVIEKLN